MIWYGTDDKEHFYGKSQRLFKISYLFTKIDVHHCNTKVAKKYGSGNQQYQCKSIFALPGPPVPQWFQFTNRATSRLSQFILSDNQPKKVMNASTFLGRLAFLVTKFQKLNVKRPGQLQNLVTQICLGIPTHMYSPLSGLTTSTVFVAKTQNEFWKKTTGCDSWESGCGVEFMLHNILGRSVSQLMCQPQDTCWG